MSETRTTYERDWWEEHARGLRAERDRKALEECQVLALEGPAYGDGETYVQIERVAEALGEGEAA